MKSKDLQPRLLYPAKLSCRMERQIKCFPDQVKLQEFTIIKPLLYDLFKKKKMIKITNSKMSYQQLNLKQNKTKQTTRTRRESQKCTSHGGLSAGREGGRMGEKIQGLRNIIGRYKIYWGVLRIV